MNKYTIVEFQKLLGNLIHDIQRENGCVVLYLKTGIRIKFKNW